VTGLSAPTAYRLADPDQQFGRFAADTLERLCAALEVQPGELLEWIPEPKSARAKAATTKPATTKPAKR
jgi:DNA-binding Xre family transcriptional regulator